MGVLQKDIDEFHTAIKARALLILIEWAGSQSELAVKVGLTRYTVRMWGERGGVSAIGAWMLGQYPGCPLSAVEMRPDIKDWTKHGDAQARQRRATKLRKSNPNGIQTVTLRLYKGALKAAKRTHRERPQDPQIDYVNAALHNAKSKPKRERIANSKS